MLSRSYLLILLGIFLLFITGCGNDEPQKVTKPKGNAVENAAVQKKQNQENQETAEEKEKAKEKTVEYRNEEYGFTLRIPESWNGKYTVEQTNLNAGEETSFVFKYKEENVDLFWIVILDISKEEWNRDFAGGLMEYLDEKDGKIYAYMTPTELPSQLSQDKKEKIHALIDVTQMMNQDVPRIVKSFKLIY